MGRLSWGREERPAVALATEPGRPQLQLLNALERGLDLEGLRAWAREVGRATGGQYLSRSYCHPYAVVAWHDHPVGVDIERIQPHDREFVASISTPEELGPPGSGHAIGQGGEPGGRDDLAYYGSDLWSSKEALAKALGDARQYDPRRLGSPLLWPAGRSGPWRAARLELPPGYVGWLCWRSSPSAGSTSS